jgi:hypothetical protein
MGIEEPEPTKPPKVCTCCNRIIKADDAKWDMLFNPLRFYHEECWDTYIRLPKLRELVSWRDDLERRN